MKRHPLDIASLLFGTIFLAIVAWWLAARSVDVALPALGWLVSLGLILVGTLGLVAAIKGGRTRSLEGGGSGAASTASTDQPVDQRWTADDRWTAEAPGHAEPGHAEPEAGDPARRDAGTAR